MSDDKQALELERLRAEADKATAEAAAAKRAEAEASTPAAAARREALAEQALAAARRAEVAALVPDLASVQRSELKVGEASNPTAGTPVGSRALQAAAAAVATAVSARLGAQASVLITSDDALAASDAAYLDVVEALDSLAELGNRVLVAPEPQESTYEVAGVDDVAGAVAKALPGVLSLLSSHRSVATGAVELDDLAASVAVAGALTGEQRTVFHDAVRLVARGGVYEQLRTVRAKRGELLARQLELEAITPSDDESAKALTAEIALARSSGERIDAQLEALTAIPEGATRSPLTAAALRQGLHDGTFGYALLVKAQSASGMQLVNDKPLWWKDTFSVIAVASITWLLIDAQGAVVDGGVATETAQLHGKIGNRVDFAG